jgi:hypothetical protein
VSCLHRDPPINGCEHIRPESEAPEVRLRRATVRERPGARVS